MNRFFLSIVTFFMALSYAAVSVYEFSRGEYLRGGDFVNMASLSFFCSMLNLEAMELRGRLKCQGADTAAEK